MAAWFRQDRSIRFRVIACQKIVHTDARTRYLYTIYFYTGNSYLLTDIHCQNIRKSNKISTILLSIFAKLNGVLSWSSSNMLSKFRQDRSIPYWVIVRQRKYTDTHAQACTHGNSYQLTKSKHIACYRHFWQKYVFTWRTRIY